MIVFEKVKYKNFLSTGNVFTEVILNKNQNTLIVGKNGSGKTSISEALYFGLFGKSLRKINKPNLINSINGKNCVVEVYFSISGKKYKVIRGMKPNIFEIYVNGNLIDQSAKTLDYQGYLEKNILKMSSKSFSQIVILGAQSFTPFMLLPAADRRAIIEDLLDIEIFSTMNVIAKQKLQNNLKELETTRSEIRVFDGKKSVIEKTLSSIKETNTTKIKSLREEISIIDEEILDIEQDISIHKQQLDSLIELTSDNKKLREKHKKYSTLQTKIETNLERQSKTVEFFQNNSICPTCHQDIDDDFKTKTIDDTNKVISEINDGLGKISDEISDIIDDIRAMDELITQMHDTKHLVSSLESKVHSLYKSRERIQKQIDEFSMSDNLVTTSKEELKVIDASIKKWKEKQEFLVNDRSYLETIISLLKDGGIKTKIIKQYLPIINKQINKYLASMDFFVNFNLDESFNETIKSRHRDDFQYSNFSNGERLRIDLSILFTWRIIAKMRNSVSTNLLILDEVFDSSLDNNGVDEFIKIIKTLASDTNIFIISHKGDALFEKFDNVIKFEKYKGFSRIVEE